jgi:hypothetical protein
MQSEGLTVFEDANGCTTSVQGEGALDART